MENNNEENGSQSNQKEMIGRTVKVRLLKSTVVVKIIEYNKWRVNKFCGRLLQDAEEISLNAGDCFLFTEDRIINDEEFYTPREVIQLISELCATNFKEGR